MPCIDIGLKQSCVNGRSVVVTFADDHGWLGPKQHECQKGNHIKHTIFGYLNKNVIDTTEQIAPLGTYTIQPFFVPLLDPKGVRCVFLVPSGHMTANVGSIDEESTQIHYDLRTS